MEIILQYLLVSTVSDHAHGCLSSFKYILVVQVKPPIRDPLPTGTIPKIGIEIDKNIIIVGAFCEWDVITTGTYSSLIGI